MSWYCQHCGHEASEAGACARDGYALTPVAAQSLLGRRLGDYRVLAKLGGGAFGTVYRAAHATTGAIVAIKLLNHPIDHKDSQRVVIEARAATLIRHPSCVEVYDLAMTKDRRPFIVMQLLDGVPLTEVMMQRLSVAEAVTLIVDVLHGLAAAHAQGVIHRDLKPGNIFIADGRAIIVDFGFAKLISDPGSPNLSITGEIVGTPAYMAPEQIRYTKPIDGRADLYAVGCVLYQLLANRLPFPGKSAMVMFRAHLDQIAPPVTAFRPEVPARISDAITRVLAKDPDARFRDADEMRVALTGAKTRQGSVLASFASARTWWIIPLIAVGLALVIAIVALMTR